MAKNIKTAVKLTAQETLAANIVKGIKAKTITIGNRPTLITRKDSKGEMYVSSKNDKGAFVQVSSIKGLEAKNPRYLLELVFPGSIKGMTNKAQFSGKYARLAWKAVTHVPAVRKQTMSEQDLVLATQAFGF